MTVVTAFHLECNDCITYRNEYLTYFEGKKSQQGYGTGVQEHLTL